MIPATKSQTPEDGFVDELKPGTPLLHGQYTIRKYLNAGGFGITYLAADSLDRTVVIKECFPGAFCRRTNMVVQARSRAFQNELGTIVQLFLKEAQSLAKLSHPNIVGVHQVFEGNNTAYMALDFIQGDEMFALISRKDPRLTPATIRTMLEKLLDAIGAVHAAGLLHRDISPDNIIVTEALEPVLIDFGAAREQATRKTRALSALRIVKDGYSPQEFYIAGSEQGPSSDLYSLAATFYHLITGDVPPNSQQRIAAQVEGRPDPYVPLAKQTGSFDAAFCAALDRAMEILPRARFPSAHDWLAAMAPKVGLLPSKPVSTPLPNAAAPISMPQFNRYGPGPFAVPVEPLKKAKAGLRPGFTKLATGGATALALLLGGIALTGGGDTMAARVEPPEAAAAMPEAGQQGKAEAGETFRSAMAGLGEAGPVAVSAASAVLSQEEIPGLGQVTIRWSPELPFATVDAASTVVSEVRGGTVLRPGLSIVAVNGQAVATLAEIEAAVLAAAPQGPGAEIRISVTLQDGAAGATETGDLAIPVVYSADVPGGVSFRAEAGAGIRVTRAPTTEDGGGLRVGDEVVALMPSRAPVPDLATLRDAVLRAAAEGATGLTLVVRRDGLIWVEPMTFVAAGG